jgi:hypothetical protein
MHRRNIMGIPALVAGLVMLPANTSAQQKSIKDQLVGAWTLLLADYIPDDGTHVSAFGPNPDGSLIFTADGHYSLQIIRYGRPAFASTDRLKGTADENKAAVEGMISYFGTYGVDEAGKTIDLRIEASSLPNFDATLTNADELAEVICKEIHDPEIAALGFTGAVDQFSDSTDLVDCPPLADAVVTAVSLDRKSCRARPS